VSLIRASAHALPLVDASVQCCVTSPPYWGLRDYGVPPVSWGDWRGSLGLEPTPDLYIAHLVLVFEEVRRVLKPDGVLWMNLGDCYATGAGKVGEHPGGGAQGERWKGGDRDGHEGKQAYRVGPQTQPNRLPIAGLKPKDLVGVPWMAAFALRAAGWYLRSDVIWSKPNPMPESVTDRPTKAHEYLFLLTKNERYFYDADAIQEQGVKVGTLGHLQGGNGERAGTRAGLRREHVAAKRLEPGSQALDSFEVCGDGLYAQRRNKRSVWQVPTQPYPDAHFATFPEALIEPCILAGSRAGDRVLDPFIGTGTVGQVAERLMRRWVGTDLGYQPLAKRRTAQRGLRLDEATA
jgi:DNA modification methylase